MKKSSPCFRPLTIENVQKKHLNVQTLQQVSFQKLFLNFYLQ